MLELFEFQEKATLKMVEKYEQYLRCQVVIKKGNEETPVPFIQILDALTASVVVEQSFNNLTSGGKYHHLLGKCQVIMLAEYRESLLFENEPLVLFATVGTFNQKDKEAGNRQIYQCKLDEQNQSTWDSLKNRGNRPLFIVYDEGHNLSDQQTDLLLELKPEVFLMASATMKFPHKLAEQFTELKKESKWQDHDFFTQVPTTEVVEAGLVKKVIQLASYENPREETISSLVEDLKAIENQLHNNLPNQKPKAIYVLEKCQVKPENIAVYCDLKFSREFPKPSEFNLFAGSGEKKYQEFTSAITHQLPELLNTAHFYIQVEKQSTFQEVIEEINRELKQNGLGIQIKPTTSAEKPEIVKVK
ncbi:16847_t:CDS:2, partial [Funneliformis geosporum]